MTGRLLRSAILTAGWGVAFLAFLVFGTLVIADPSSPTAKWGGVTPPSKLVIYLGHIIIGVGLLSVPALWISASRQIWSGATTSNNGLQLVAARVVVSDPGEQ
jgi:hypothetical protein